MPHGFTTDIDDADHLRFRKRHKNGEETIVDIDRKIPGEDFEVEVSDPRGNVNLGRFATKSKAKKRAKRFMRENPKGVPASDNGITGMSGGIPGTNGNGLF